MPLRLYNTLTRKLEDFAPADPSRVTFYTCGPTVYDDAHIGNFRSFLAADLLRRWIESPLCELANETTEQKARREKQGRSVVHVMNITDVGHMTDDAEGGEHGEDRMAVAGRRIAEAKKSGKLPADAKIDPSNPYEIAEFYASRFLEDARKLGLKVAIEAEKDAALMPRATANVPGMIAVIQRLIEKGHAYAVGAPGARVVYFDVRSFAPYGRLSGNTLDQLKEGEGGRISADNQSQKKHPADFLLWKEDAGHIMKWQSPWGAGYPGWHIECTVMSLRGTRGRGAPFDPRAFDTPGGVALIDLHSGGEDNIFPHHECEIAQSCCAFNASPQQGSFAKMWFHPRFLLVEGTKMSKSKGNFYTARDLFAKGIEPAAVRLELIKTHYRSNANFTMQGLKDSQRTLDRWRSARWDIARRSWAWQGVSTRVLLDLLQQNIAICMNDDLNVAGAIAAVNSAITHATSLPVDASKVPAWSDQETEDWCRNPEVRNGEPHPIDIFRRIEPVFGVLSLDRPTTVTSDIGVFAPGVEPSDAVNALLEERRAARASKNFKRSDEIRDELHKAGYAIKDMAGGKVEVRRA